MRKITGITLVIFSLIVILIYLFNLLPISQSLTYHDFSDKKKLFQVPNLLNVISNLPFLFVGLLGLYKLYMHKTLAIIVENRLAYYALFSGTALVFVGSSYYHLSPDNNTLAWDRLPMTIAFMALFSIIISEYLSVIIGKFLLFPLIIVGLFSVYYWQITELNGQGDLRLYALIQFYPLIAIPIILTTCKPAHNGSIYYWWLFVAYILAKVLEYFDQEIHDYLVIISGHSLKHIAAAIGVYIVLRSYEIRTLRA